ncbi:2-phosphosulfolactate phosphatase [Micromonospora sp. NPDC023644]|uniref:2-phosphosulfolactate phosphatase n=1 Tax=Micromonospora sp. NPDC023644 TaxID=3154321 RepID=UPI0033E3D64B
MVSDVLPGREPDAFDPWPDERVHVEWSDLGARLAADRGDAIVVVDVLSFSTTLTMAAERGIRCHVHSKAELAERGGAELVAAALGAVPAAAKRDARPGQLSLSPASLREVGPEVSAALFTSLNGARAVSAAAGAAQVALGCLRNRSAVAALVASWLGVDDRLRVTIVACGEHWSSTSRLEGLRPALEDQLGAGAIADALAELGYAGSVEAQAAAAVFRALGTTRFTDLVGARELVTAGFPADVALAAEVDVTAAVPMLSRDAGERCFIGWQPHDSEE